jgi:hypothetical protein
LKNKLTDLNDHLFLAIERLNNESLVGEKLHEEIARSKTLASLACNAIENGRLMLDAAEFSAGFRDKGAIGGGLKLLTE